jgi:hypothetical protein
MKNIIKKKRVLFPIIFFGEIAIVAVIAIIFDLETGDSPLGVAYAYVMAFTLMGFVLKILKDHKTELSNMELPFVGSIIWMLYTVFIVIIFVLVILTISIIHAILTA